MNNLTKNTLMPNTYRAVQDQILILKEQVLMRIDAANEIVGDLDAKSRDLINKSLEILNNISVNITQVEDVYATLKAFWDKLIVDSNRWSLSELNKDHIRDKLGLIYNSYISLIIDQFNEVVRISEENFNLGLEGNLDNPIVPWSMNPFNLPFERKTYGNIINNENPWMVLRTNSNFVNMHLNNSSNLQYGIAIKQMSNNIAEPLVDRIIKGNDLHEVLVLDEQQGTMHYMSNLSESTAHYVDPHLGQKSYPFLFKYSNYNNRVMMVEKTGNLLDTNLNMNSLYDRSSLFDRNLNERTFVGDLSMRYIVFSGNPLGNTNVPQALNRELILKIKSYKSRISDRPNTMFAWVTETPSDPRGIQDDTLNRNTYQYTNDLEENTREPDNTPLEPAKIVQFKNNSLGDATKKQTWDQYVYISQIAMEGNPYIDVRSNDTWENPNINSISFLNNKKYLAEISKLNKKRKLWTQLNKKGFGIGALSSESYGTLSDELDIIFNETYPHFATMGSHFSFDIGYFDTFFQESKIDLNPYVKRNFTTLHYNRSYKYEIGENEIPTDSFEQKYRLIPAVDFVLFHDNILRIKMPSSERSVSQSYVNFNRMPNKIMYYNTSDSILYDPRMWRNWFKIYEFDRFVTYSIPIPFTNYLNNELNTYMTHYSGKQLKNINYETMSISNTVLLGNYTMSNASSFPNTFNVSNLTKEKGFAVADLQSVDGHYSVSSTRRLFSQNLFNPFIEKINSMY